MLQAEEVNLLEEKRKLGSEHAAGRGSEPLGGEEEARK